MASKRTYGSIVNRAHKLKINFQNPREWAQEEDNIILEKYESLGAVGLVELLPLRNRSQIADEAKKLGVNYDAHLWTQGEEDILYKYRLVDPKKATELLPTRTFKTCQQHAIKLRLLKGPCWTEEELSVLKKYYPQGGKYEVVKHLSTKSLDQIASKASILHLKSPNYTKSVKCLETNQIYSSAEEAKRITGIKTIDSCARHKCKTAGGYHWVYEGDNSTIEDIELNRKVISKKVRCIETGEIFETAGQAKKKYPGARNLSKVIKGTSSYAGTLPDGTKLHWEYIED